MTTVEKSITVESPVRTVYNQWTQFEEFPKFMDGLEEVRQVDDSHISWRAKIAGREESWDSEIVSQVPDERISWRSIDGAVNTGLVTFTPIDSSHTKVNLRLEYEPQGTLETVGSWLGSVSSRVEGDLERFKEYIEDRGSESGEWRGHIHAGEVKQEQDRELPANMGKRAWAEEMRVEGEEKAIHEGGNKRASNGPPPIDPRPI